MKRPLGQTLSNPFFRVVVPGIDECIEPRIDALGPLDRFLQDLEGGKLSAPDQTGDIGCIEIGIALNRHRNLPRKSAKTTL